MPTSSQSSGFYAQLRQHLECLYPDANSNLLTGLIISIFDNSHQRVPLPDQEPWTQQDCWLITYGDSVVSRSTECEAEKPLQTLNRLLEDFVDDAITGVHVLPFSPYSSDDGFAVIDYTAVNPDLGDWQDISAIGNRYRVMADLVINHVSSESQWFKNYQQGVEPGATWFYEANAGDDLSAVVRPRTSPLLRPTETPDGIKHVWCTFSHDQIDLDFRNPQVLMEFLRIIRLYLEKGVRIFRLDAIGFLWKEPGTNCIHLSQTHEVVRLIRCVCDYFAPGTIIITETNVPNHENLTYFGNRNEAHLIYNFSLAPLLVHALLSGSAQYLKRWMMSMPRAPLGCTYLNFTASHDGIGMRPAEGLLSDQEQLQMVDAIRRHGGRISARRGHDGAEHVYELNISLIDAFQGTIHGPDEWQIQRFLCSQTVMLGLEGIPAFYIHSLLGTHNDTEAVEKTGHNRSINRHKWDDETLRQQLNDADSEHAQILQELLRRTRLRCQQTAFHPSAMQFTLQLNDCFFAFWRQSMDKTQNIFCVHNLSNLCQDLRLSDLNLVRSDSWQELLTSTKLEDVTATIPVQPYQCLWISNG